MNRRDFMKLSGGALATLCIMNKVELQPEQTGHWVYVVDERSPEYKGYWHNGHWSLVDHVLWGSDNIRVIFYPISHRFERYKMLPSDFKCIVISRTYSHIPAFVGQFIARWVESHEALFLSAARGCVEMPYDVR